MDIIQTLRELCALPGVAGQEEKVAARVREAFVQAGAKDVYSDRMFNTYGRMTDQGGGPKVLICAHMDEIGMIVSDIDERGFLHFENVGGIDRRILPCQEVWVWGKEKLFGVVGSKPPHVLGEEERKKAAPHTDMAVDVGLPAERVREKVRIGDMITFAAPLYDLNGEWKAGKTMDDRACIAVLLEAMEQLSKMKFYAEPIFAATVQEEVGIRGAKMAGFHADPDIGVAVDVTHGETPDVPRYLAFPMDKPAMTVGPNIHPRLSKKLMEIAEKNGIPYTKCVSPAPTGTDANALQTTRDGVPSLLLEIPLRYMHTTVETVNYQVVRACGRWLAQFIAALPRDWEEWTCL